MKRVNKRFWVLFILAGVLSIIGAGCAPAQKSTTGGTDNTSGTDSSSTGTDGTTGTDGSSDTDNGGVGDTENGGVVFKYVQPYTPSADDLSWVDNVVNTLDITGMANELRGVPVTTPQFDDIFTTIDHDGIKGFEMRDGPRGACLAPYLGNRDGYATSFPTGIARGASFDLELEKEIGKAQGSEVQAAGGTIILGPCVNLLRHPAWGRAQETYGEDTFLLGRMGTVFSLGAQEHIPACAKHYVANNIEENRFNSNSLMDEQTLREVYANIYKMIIQDGGVASIMAAYNSLNGTKCTENKHVLTEILRDDFGFLGFVMSDWWAMTNGTSTDKWQGDYEQAAVNGLNAGLDLEMGWALNYAQIENAVSNGNLTTDTVKTAAKRVLLQKKRFNVHDPNEQNPGLAAPPVSYDSTTGSITGNDDHIALAKKAALESMVLLKNSNGTLPIDTATVSKIAVIGANVSFSIDSEDKKYGGTIDFARDNHTGDLGSSRVWDDPAKGVGPYDGIKNAVGADAEVVVGNTASAAGDADVVVVVAGLTPQDEGEEYTGAGDRSSFALDAKISGTPQTDLINDVIALGKPVIVVLVGGSVIDMPWKDSVDAIVMSWYSGMVGGSALGELLTGQANFSGKLPFTWAAWNSYPDFNPGVTVKMDYYTGYRYFDQNNLTPDYPFGYGLSYSTYEYGDVTLTSETAGEDDVVTALVDITNSSDVDGTEVVMLFASYPDTAARRSAKELKGFERVDVPAGATVTAKVPFRIKDLKYYDETQSAWVLEKGTVNIGVGSSAENLQGAVSLTIQ